MKRAFEAAIENRSSETFEALFEVWQKGLSPQALAVLGQVGQANKFSVADILQLSVTFLQATLTSPITLVETLDILSQAWIEGQPELLHQKLSGSNFQTKMSQAAWQLFWANIEAPVLENIVERIREFYSGMDRSVRADYLATLLEREGVKEAAEAGFVRPPTLMLESLADYPQGTFGHAFYHQIADNNLNLEFIKERRENTFEDRGADYVGLRIYQTHDIWHVLLGYGISGLDELGLQGFQLAQVGSPSAAILLSLYVARAILRDYNGLFALLNYIFQGWQHGRQTVPLLPVEWEALWAQPLAEVRERYQIQIQRERKLLALRERKKSRAV